MANGNVEGTIGYGRRNFLVPMPRFDSFDDLNVRLEEQCLIPTALVVDRFGPLSGSD